MPLGKKVGLDPRQIVLDGDPAPLPERTAPILSPCLCGQMAGWIKVSVGTNESLDSGDFALDGDSLPPKRGTAPNFFSPMSVVVKGLDGSRCHLV